MCKLNVSDFYFGAFLSALLNASRSRPVLFDETGSRRIYRLETDNAGESYVYAKFVTQKNADGKKRWRWTFNFSDAEVLRIQELYRPSNNVKLALICAKDGFAGSELAVVDYREAMDCLGVDKGVKNYRITIKTMDNQHGLRMYGSGRSDKINGKDNTLVVTRTALEDI